MLKILIVEDEENLGITLLEYLESTGFETKWANTASKAEQLFIEFRPDLILMDIQLPDGNGIDLCKKFRKMRLDFSFLILSAMNDPETKVLGLEIGAEDYMTKPFALKELNFRINRVLKSKEISNQLPDVIEHGKLKIWFKRFQVSDANENILNLSQKECAILELLYKRKNEAVDRNEIVEKIWGEDKFPSNRTVDNYIVSLRKWCETDELESIRIESIRSIGYKLILK